jgi:hypothetical protein
MNSSALHVDLIEDSLIVQFGSALTKLFADACEYRFAFETPTNYDVLTRQTAEEDTDGRRGREMVRGVIPAALWTAPPFVHKVAPRSAVLDSSRCVRADFVRSAHLCTAHTVWRPAGHTDSEPPPPLHLSHWQRHHRRRRRLTAELLRSAHSLCVQSDDAQRASPCRRSD